MKMSFASWNEILHCLISLILSGLPFNKDIKGYMFFFSVAYMFTCRFYECALLFHCPHVLRPHVSS